MLNLNFYVPMYSLQDISKLFFFFEWHKKVSLNRITIEIVVRKHTEGEIKDVSFIAYLDALGDVMDVKKTNKYFTNNIALIAKIEWPSKNLQKPSKMTDVS